MKGGASFCSQKQLQGPTGRSSLLTGLVSYWKMEEASGTRNDSHGSNNLTDNNTVTQNPGKVDNAAQFTAANSEFLSIADNASIRTGNIDFMLVVWVYLDSLGDLGRFVTKTGSADEYYLSVNPQNLVVFGYSDGAGTYKEVISVSTLLASTWSFVVGWRDKTADTVNVQINNGAVDSISGAGVIPASSTDTFRIGSYNGSIQFMDGRIDEVGFWKRVLTAAERTQLWNNGLGRQYPFQ